MQGCCQPSKITERCDRSPASSQRRLCRQRHTGAREQASLSPHSQAHLACKPTPCHIQLAARDTSGGSRKPLCYARLQRLHRSGGGRTCGTNPTGTIWRAASRAGPPPRPRRQRLEPPLLRRCRCCCGAPLQAALLLLCGAFRSQLCLSTTCRAAMEACVAWLPCSPTCPPLPASLPRTRLCPCPCTLAPALLALHTALRLVYRPASTLLTSSVLSNSPPTARAGVGAADEQPDEGCASPDGGGRKPEGAHAEPAGLEPQRRRLCGWEGGADGGC